MLGSVRPSLNPGVSISLNSFASGSLPLAMALNAGAYLLFGLYATTIDVAAYCTNHVVNFGSSGTMLSFPTLSKTFGVITFAAISDESSPEAPARPEY